MNFPSSPTLSQTYTFNGKTWEWNGDAWDLQPADPLAGYTGATSISTLGTINVGTWNGDVIIPLYGGTGISSYTTGNFLYAVNSTTLGQRTPSQVLSDIGGLASSSYTASDVLTKILTVDGAGSNIDSDLLDGQQGSYYLDATNLTGTISAARSWALTGDVTSPAGSAATTIANSVISLGKMANLAANSLIGNNTGVAATPLALTAAQVRTLLNVADGSTANLGTVTSVAMSVPTGLSISGTPITTSGTLALTYAAGYQGYTSVEATKLAAITGTNTGDQTITLTGNVTGSGTGSFATTIAAGVVTLAMQASVATGTVFYRKTAATGAPEVQTLATLKTDLGLTGTNSGDQTITLTGDVTGTGTGSFATAIGSNKVTLSMMAQVATGTFLGRTTAATGNVEAMTSSQAKTLLSLTKADVGLSAVENTALSTWAGSANITTLGTIATGTWNATIIGISKGGTGATTATAAFDALAPTTTLGDITYFSTTSTRLAGNTTSTKQFLSQTGTGTVSAAPIWSAVNKTDVGLSAVENTALSTWAGSANITTLGTVATGTWNATTISIAKGGTGATTSTAAFDSLAPTTTLGDITYFAATSTRLAGNTTATKKFLTQTGTGTVSAAPAWGTIANTDVSGLGTLATQSGTFSGTSSGTNTGDQTITLTGNVTGTGTGSFATTIAAGVVTLAMQANVATGTVFYRKTAATGSPEVQTLATLKTDLGLTGTNSGDQTITLTGDVTGTGTSSFATAIGSNKVTLGMMAQVATATFLGRTTAATGNVEAMTVTQAKTLLALVKADVGLGSVENTALSTWAGSSTITTLGTVATGTWNATTIGISKGGTGATTAAAAFDALAPTTTLGDITYCGTGNTSTRLAGNATSAKQFLSQTGTGTVSAAPVWSAVSKTDVGLSAVENTALSTWAGSANITTLGTIATGVWNGTIITPAKLGTGTANSTTFLRGDGTWGAVSGGSSTLASLTDVTLGTLTTGEFLRYNGTVWVDAALVAGDIPNLDWTKITTGKPTTLSGYGITDAAALAGAAFTGASSVDSGGGVATVNRTLRISNGSQWFDFIPNLTAGSFNSIVQASDHALIFSNNASGTGAMVIAPWGGGASMRLDSNGNFDQRATTHSWASSTGASFGFIDSTGITVTGLVAATGSLGILNFDNRSGTARTYGMYATANVIRIWAATIGDIITIAEDGTMTAKTQTLGDNSTKVATTAFVNTPNVQAVASSATVTPAAGNDMVTITAQAAALTLANPTGTWLQGQGLVIRIKDNGTARAITYGTNYRAVGVTRPTTTVLSKTVYIGVIYNATDTKWDIVSVAQE